MVASCKADAVAAAAAGASEVLAARATRGAHAAATPAQQQGHKLILMSEAMPSDSRIERADFEAKPTDDNDDSPVPYSFTTAGTERCGSYMPLSAAFCSAALCDLSAFCSRRIALIGRTCIRARIRGGRKGTYYIINRSPHAWEGRGGREPKIGLCGPWKKAYLGKRHFRRHEQATLWQGFARGVKLRAVQLAL